MTHDTPDEQGLTQAEKHPDRVTQAIDGPGVDLSPSDAHLAGVYRTLARNDNDRGTGHSAGTNRAVRPGHNENTDE